jgi:hypothetical protein
VGLGVVRLKHQRLPQACDRLLRPAALGQGHAQVVVALGAVGPHAHGLAQVNQGLVHPAALAQSDPQGGEGVGVVGLQAQRLAVVLGGLVALPLPGKRAAQLEVGGGRGPDAQDLAEGGRRLGAALLIGQGQAEQVPQVGVVGVGPQQLAVQRLGTSGAAGTVQGAGTGEGFGVRRPGGASGRGLDSGGAFLRAVLQRVEGFPPPCRSNSDQVG